MLLSYGTSSFIYDDDIQVCGSMSCTNGSSHSMPTTSDINLGQTTYENTKIIGKQNSMQQHISPVSTQPMHQNQISFLTQRSFGVLFLSLGFISFPWSLLLNSPCVFACKDFMFLFFVSAFQLRYVSQAKTTVS